MSAKANIKKRRGIEPLTRAELVTLNSLQWARILTRPKLQLGRPAHSLHCHHDFTRS